MTTSPLIVCFGGDQRLLASRQMLFRYAGFATEITMDVAELEQMLRERAIDLLVFCHSLSQEDCEIGRRLALRSARCPRLLFLAAGPLRWEAPAGSNWLDTWLNPASLLEAVQRLLDSPDGLYDGRGRFDGTSAPVPDGDLSQANRPGRNGRARGGSKSNQTILSWFY